MGSRTHNHSPFYGSAGIPSGGVLASDCGRRPYSSYGFGAVNNSLESSRCIEESASKNIATPYAGMSCDRLQEIISNTTKLPSLVKNDSTNINGIFNNRGSQPALLSSHLENAEISKESSNSKRSIIQYLGDREQNKHFVTRWKPDVTGKMEFCISRKEGNAHVELDYDYLDVSQTFYKEKSSIYSKAKSASSLQNDRFLTVRAETKGRTDAEKPIINRDPPFANPDGPFEKPRPGTHPNKDNLNRALVPRQDAGRGDDTNKRKALCQPAANAHSSNVMLQYDKHFSDADEVSTFRRSKGAAYPWERDAGFELSHELYKSCELTPRESVDSPDGQDSRYRNGNAGVKANGDSPHTARFIPATKASIDIRSVRAH